jgi:rubredoxin
MEIKGLANYKCPKCGHEYEDEVEIDVEPPEDPRGDM